MNVDVKEAYDTLEQFKVPCEYYYGFFTGAQKKHVRDATGLGFDIVERAAWLHGMEYKIAQERGISYNITQLLQEILERIA